MTASVRDGRAHLRVGENALTASAGDGVNAGVAVEVMVRPTATRLEDVEGSGMRDGLRHRMPARIVDVAYRGRGYDHVVDTSHGLLTSVFDERPWSRGDECMVAIDPTGMIAFPAS